MENLNDMEFVKFELRQNIEQKCHCCNAFIKYVVILSDGNKYGKDCAKRLISGNIINHAEKEYFDKNNPTFKVGIQYPNQVSEILCIKAKSESDAIRIRHKGYNSNKNTSIWKGSRCLWRGKTLGTEYETTIDKFVIVD